MSNSFSSRVLIGANVVPLFGVVLFDWDMLAILLLYWIETAIVGAINVLRMISCQNPVILEGMIEVADRRGSEQVGQDFQQESDDSHRFFLVTFFIVHYGLFCFVHVSMLVEFFGTGPARDQSVGAELGELWHGPFLIAVAAIFASRLFSFFANYIGGGEYKSCDLQTLMLRPYGRVVVMHLAIIFGAALGTSIGSPLPTLLILIVGKTLIDMHLHERERSKLAAPA